MDYEKLINKFTNRRDYFKTMDFQQHADDLDKAIEAIKSLIEEKNSLEEKLKNIEEKK